MTLWQLEPQQSQIRDRVAADYSGWQAGAVMENNQNLTGTVHDVGVRENRALLSSSTPHPILLFTPLPR